MNLAHPTPSAAPLARDALVDQLRGLALLAIALANMNLFAYGTTDWSTVPLRNWADQLLQFLRILLVDAKFYVLFCFLFGYSLSYLIPLSAQLAQRHSDAPDQPIQAHSLWPQWVVQRKRFVLRTIGLLFIGIMHATFVFVGDIVTTYAIAGLGCLYFATATDRSVLRTALWWYICLITLTVLLLWAFSGSAPSNDGPDPWQLYQARAGAAGWAELIQLRWAILKAFLKGEFLLHVIFVLPIMLLGIVAGRHHVLTQPQTFNRLWWIGLLVALPLGLASSAISTWLLMSAPAPTPGQYNIPVYMGQLLLQIFGWLQTFGYVAAAALLAQRGVHLPALFTVAGRCSLSHYVGQSVLMLLIFSGIGLSLARSFALWQTMLLGILMWLVLAITLRAWLQRFDAGPLELLLRAWTRAIGSSTIGTTTNTPS